MARSPRLDTPGSWHHVMNRGLARRTVFENRDDVRAFLAGIACAVRREEIEVHAYCVLTTHFHALVRSPHGRLSEAMRRIQNAYVRRFNRLRRRDGPLFRGRFRSRPVESLSYRRLLVRYIDANPVSAGLVSAPELYPHGSARHYARASGPPWLERAWIERTVRDVSRGSRDLRSYAAVFGGPLRASLRSLVELRTARAARGSDPLDDLVHATPARIRAWMRRKARLADGTGPGLPVCDPTSVVEVVAAARRRSGSWTVHPGQKPVDAWLQVQAGLLCDLCGRTSSQVARALVCSESGVAKLRARHRVWMLEDERYAARVAQLVVEALVRCGLRDNAETEVKYS